MLDSDLATTNPDRSGAVDRTADVLVEPAIELVERWIARSTELESRADRVSMERLRDLVLDDRGVEFVMGFVDRVARPEDHAVAATQLSGLVAEGSLPSFLSPIDRVLLRAGAQLAPYLPRVVIPLARRRMRSIVGHLVAPADPQPLAKHLESQRSDGYQVNVNLLGEAVLGEREAEARLQRLIELLHQPDIDYVSVKISAVASQLNHWDAHGSLVRVAERAALLLDAAAEVSPPTFINFDMEEYDDLHLTVEAFKQVLGEPARLHMDAGIVLQAYLPDVFAILRDLVAWANARHEAGGGTIKIRLVKGANLAMERVDAAIHGWEQAPFGSKVESDASYRRCLDWVLTADHLAGVRIGLASHNLFDIAWATLLADERGVSDRVQFEMLQGMAPGQAKAVSESTSASSGSELLLYTPAVAEDDFDVAIGYLFRRLEENASTENFMRSLLDLTPAEVRSQTAVFREGVELRHHLDFSPRRTQDRRAEAEGTAVERDGGPFVNEPETDPISAANQQWIADVMALPAVECITAVTTSIETLDERLQAARAGAQAWAQTSGAERREILHRVGDELSRRRGELIAAMRHHASKTIAEADGEVSEAIDFARWYGDRAIELESIPSASFTPFGVVGVIPPWNFPSAIPAGGALAALAAGNGVILKPAPQAPRCSEIVAEACWAAGVPAEALQFVRTPDDHVGRHLVESVDAVILTGSSETADLFRSWKRTIRLFAETSGKNVLIVTPNADLDLAVKDLVQSAFGHGGQKCSAASLAILVGDVADSDRFRRQLIDATESLTVGDAGSLGTDIAPLVDGGNDRLDRALSTLEPGESWLVKPSRTGAHVSPGIRDGVVEGSWFHTTECFGPVLGLMRADSLDEAIRIANSSAFGLTGGIHSLDPAEISHWADTIEIGNGYVNRPITGAIVQRQPFGGWKRSSVGLGAKAGGPNYVMQLGRWAPIGAAGAESNDDYDAQWRSHFSIDHDETGLECEANVFRYRSAESVGLWTGAGADPGDLQRVRRAAALAGVRLVEASHEGGESEPFIRSLAASGIERVRLVGCEQTDEMARMCGEHGIHIIDGPVTASGRLELQHYVREQAMSVTLHRFGNLVGARGL